jgi:hypothetical protein
MGDSAHTTHHTTPEEISTPLSLEDENIFFKNHGTNAAVPPDIEVLFVKVHVF